ncbi:MAG: NADH-quinone oxidoreductase subunit NuoG, partial [bacterium]
MSDFEITIDGKQVPVTKGQTVLQAALAAGIEIPVFCWHPQLVPVGACRICLVEIEKFPKLQVACATFAGDGMVVYTKSEKVIKARQGVLEFILAHHPLDCPTCDKGGECDLQDITFKYGKDYSRLRESKHRFVRDPNSTFDDYRIGPEIIRNQNRCIHCYRCTRLVNEAFMEDDLGAYQRGHHTEILPPPGREIRNLYSGNIVEYCPVGALTNTDWRYKVRVWLTKQAPAICPHCPDGCNLTLWSFHDHLWRATARTNDYIDNGLICDIGRYGYQYAHSPERVKRPMIKKAGELVEVTWGEALDFIKSQTDGLKKKLSGSGFFGLVGGNNTNEEIYAFSRFLRRVVGCNNIDHRLRRKRKLRLNDQGPVVEHGDELEFSDIDKANVVLVLGSDLHSENPITALRVKKAIRFNQAQLILANPRPTPLGIRAATREAIYQPGTEAVFILGLIDAIIDVPGIELGALGLNLAVVEDFRRKHGQYARTRAAEICGVSVSELEAIAEKLARAERVVILTGHEVCRHPYREAIYAALNNLKCFCKAAVAKPLPVESNSRGAQLFGAEPDLLPGLTPLSDKQKYEDLWQGPISESVGRDTIGILQGIVENEIECGFVFGADPLRVYPDAQRVKSALDKLKLLVVMDSFMTETTRTADCVLPLATFAESSGSRVNWEGRLQYSHSGIAVQSDVKSGCEIIELLAEKLGVKFDQPTPEAVYREMIQALPIKAPQNPRAIGQAGVLVRFDRQPAEATLAEVEYNPLPEDEEYPYVLLVGQADHHRGLLTEKCDSLVRFTDEALVVLSRKQADAISVAAGVLVKVESKYG